MLAGEASRLNLQGGTHNPMAPPFHFLERSFAPLVRRLGAGVDLNLRRHGFYPAGGGEIEATLHPAAPDGLRAFDLLDRGELRAAYAECLAPGLPRAVAQRELEAIARELGWSGEQLRTPAVRQNEGPGNALMATLEHQHVTEVFTHFGEKGVSAEKVAHSVVGELRRYQARGAAIGAHLADQWALPLALAVWQRGGQAAYTCSELSDHTTTNFDVIARFLPLRFETAAIGAHWRVTVARV
jgi:RNA 3'-terminal phosphate cyclase (ATP)